MLRICTHCFFFCFFSKKNMCLHTLFFLFVNLTAEKWMASVSCIFGQREKALHSPTKHWKNSVNASFLWTASSGLLHSKEVLLTSLVLPHTLSATWHDGELLEDTKKLVKCHTFTPQLCPFMRFCIVIHHSALEVFSISKLYCSWAASHQELQAKSNCDVVGLKT